MHSLPLQHKLLPVPDLHPLCVSIIPEEYGSATTSSGFIFTAGRIGSISPPFPRSENLKNRASSSIVTIFASSLIFSAKLESVITSLAFETASCLAIFNRGVERICGGDDGAEEGRRRARGSNRSRTWCARNGRRLLPPTPSYLTD
ncbi:unnamed protein product [Linum trigynum]|uniref:Uncharacterized protein n=1 Tax=Linum trigynum TaxID=586398 RepID=A0AAV2FA39_9ROSI